MTKSYHAVQFSAVQLPLFALSKVCSTCHQDKNLDCFPKGGRYCKDCKNAARRSEYAAQRSPEPIPLPGHKFCSDCKNEKPFAEFYPMKTGQFGRGSACKICRCTKAQNERDAYKESLHATFKICTACHQEKPFDSFPLRGSQCKLCREEAREAYDREYRLAHREEMRLMSRKHYLANQERVLARTHEYYATHREQYHEYWKKRKQDPIDRARHNAHARRYNRTERRRAYNREYCRRTRSGNPKWQEYDRKRNQKPERIAWRQEATKQWRADHPLQHREHNRRRQARKRHSVIEKVSYKAILERDGYYCYICESSIDPAIKRGPASLHFDHVIPLAKCGQHIASNIAPTHACCNTRKQARLLESMTEWDRRGPDA